MKEEINKIFDKGITLRDSGNLIQATNVFLRLIQDYPDDPKLGGTCTVLAGIYFDLNDFDNALTYFMKATQLNPKSELASLGLYLTYVETNKYDMAINELERYLNEYPADLYKDTLKELLEDLENGYAAIYNETIRRLALKNNIPGA